MFLKKKQSVCVYIYNRNLQFKISYKKIPPKKRLKCSNTDTKENIEFEYLNLSFSIWCCFGPIPKKDEQQKKEKKSEHFSR